MTAGSASLTLAAWRGRRILILLCTVAFLDFVDASITNVAIPHIRTALHFSAQDLQWVPSAYLLTYGGFMLLGGRLADPTGRRTWGAAKTWWELAGAAVLLAAFGMNERITRDPLLPLGIFRTRGLLAANVTSFVGFSGLLAMFCFLTLYMQNVLGYSPVKAGAAYLPLTFAVGVSSGAGAKLLTKIGSRPVIVAGALIAAAGMFLLGHVPVHGTYAPSILPGLLLIALGMGPVFVGVTSAANSGVPADKAGVAAAILNSSQQTGGALGLAIMSAVATSQTTHLVARGLDLAQASTSGYQHALLTGCGLTVDAALVALRIVNTRQASMMAGQSAPADENLPDIELTAARTTD
jgi:MFS family permease